MRQGDCEYPSLAHGFPSRFALRDAHHGCLIQAAVQLRCTNKAATDTTSLKGASKTRRIDTNDQMIRSAAVTVLLKLTFRIELRNVKSFMRCLFLSFATGNILSVTYLYPSVGHGLRLGLPSRPSPTAGSHAIRR